MGDAVDHLGQIAHRAAGLDHGQVRPRGGASLPALDDHQIDRRQDLFVARIPARLDGHHVHHRDVIGASHHGRQIERQHQRRVRGQAK